MTTQTSRNSASNSILATLPRRVQQRLLRQLQPVTLEFGQILYEPGREIGTIYFPLDCLVSLLTVVDKRRSLEVGMVGNEGMTGLPVPLGVGVSGVRATVQGAGEALCMASAPFKREFDRIPLLQRAVDRYTYALMAQISQTAACNRFHDAEQRLSRWLLMTADRVGSSEFPLTQAFMAHMLGLRRAGVTRAASELKRRRLIDYARGQLKILNRRGLMRSSCSCYQIVNEVFLRAELGPDRA